MCRALVASHEECHWLRRRIVHMLDAAILLSVLVLQGTIMNYYMISHYRSSVNAYFWFIADFVCLFAFAGTLWISYKYFRKQKIAEATVNDFQLSPKKIIKNYPTSKLGILPLSYISWLFYSCILLGKIIIIFKSEIPDQLKEDETFGPQLLKITIALSGIIFLLLVEGHNYAERDSSRFVYITSICSKTGIEILDTVSLLSLLFVNETRQVLTFTLENAVITLSSIHFLLPTLALYKLSLSDFATVEFPLPLTVLYNLLHLCLIDIPYLWIRIYLWVNYNDPTSIFLMKNVLGIIFVLRSIYPDLYALRQRHRRISKKKDNKDQVEMQTMKPDGEKSQTLNSVTSNHKSIQFEEINLKD